MLQSRDRLAWTRRNRYPSSSPAQNTVGAGYSEPSTLAMLTVSGGKE